MKLDTKTKINSKYFMSNMFFVIYCITNVCLIGLISLMIIKGLYLIMGKDVKMAPDPRIAKIMKIKQETQERQYIVLNKELWDPLNMINQ